MVGCVELFAREGIRSVTELKGKRVGVQAIGLLPNIFIDLMAAEVGLRPERDIDWVPTRRSSRRSCSSTAKSTGSSAVRRNRRSCAAAASASSKLRRPPVVAVLLLPAGRQNA
jgi:hypothetical protein